MKLARNLVSTLGTNAPSIVLHAGSNARFAWEEFFFGRLRSKHTRRAYMRAVTQLLSWCELRAIPLTGISPAHIGCFMDGLNTSIASKKQSLAAWRHFFDGMVSRHAIALNPALSVRSERYNVVEGKTPEITVKQARKLLSSIDGSTQIGLRDKCIISILIYTAARRGAIARLRANDLYDAGDQYLLHFIDKGGKSREIPVRHDLQRLLLDYQQLSEGLLGPEPTRPMFTSAKGKCSVLSKNPITDDDIGRMVKRRLKSACLPARLSAHSFRVATITDLLSQGVPLEEVPQLAGHADPRTTRLYDRRQRRITRNIVERISI